MCGAVALKHFRPHSHSQTTLTRTIFKPFDAQPTGEWIVVVHLVYYQSSDILWRFHLVVLKLKFEKFAVLAVFLEQFVVCAHFHQPSFVQHNNLIGILDCTQAVSNDY